MYRFPLLPLALALALGACDGDPAKSGDVTDADGDGVDDDDDCEPDDDTVFPGADEVPYDDIDQDCDGEDLTDVDGDGHEGEPAGGDDCDDNDASVSPSESETAYDGVDQDCSGTDLTDVDGDGHDAENVGGTDCDDNDDLVSPDVVDVPYDGVDQDCDGVDLTDVDEDGFDGGTAGDDCDDDDDAINPGATEVCGNGVDEDCDGGMGPCGGFVLGGLDSSAIAVSDPSLFSWGDEFGGGLASGDLNDDGVLDLVVGGSGIGEVYVFFGPIVSDADVDPASPDAMFYGDTANDLAGHAITVVPDVNGDGVDDLVVGEPASEGPVLSGTWPEDAGAAYLLTSPFSGEATLDSAATLTMWGPGSDDFAGFSLDSAGDFDDDGVPDLLIGAPDDKGTGGGRVYVVSGSLTGPVDLDLAATVELVGVQTPNSSFRPNGDAGLRVAGAGDVDGDGVDDVWVAEPGFVNSSCANCKAGVVRLVLGGDTVTGTRSLNQAHASFEGNMDIGEAGNGLAGDMDLNDDGHPDVAIGAPNALSLSDPTRVYVVLGPFGAGDKDLDPHADIVLEGEQAGAGQSVALAGDTNGDGTPELLVTDPYFDDPLSGFAWVGKVYVVNGPWTGGTYALADSPGVMGSLEDQQLGGQKYQLPTPLASLGDQDADGFDDIAVGAGAENQVFVFAGGLGW